MVKEWRYIGSRKRKQKRGSKLYKKRGGRGSLGTCQEEQYTPEEENIWYIPKLPVLQQGLGRTGRTRTVGETGSR